MYKKNSGLIAKTRVRKYKIGSVFNRKVSVCKSATIPIPDHWQTFELK